MTREEFSRVLDALSEQTQYLYYHLMGEPLTHPQLPEFLRMAGERGYRSILTTNGTLLHRCGDALLEAGVHKVNLSLHSFEAETGEAHARYLCRVADFAKKAAERGVIVVFRLWNRGFDGGKNDVTLALLREQIPGEWAEHARGIKIRDHLYLEWGERFEWPDRDAPDGGDEVFCYGLSDHFGILADGTVVPCCLDSEGTVALGNIFRDGLAAILSSPRAEAIREGFKRRRAAEDLCRRCGYARRF
jgi:radical SAM protein with 4Fe4S-binding SPASM domain